MEQQSSGNRRPLQKRSRAFAKTLVYRALMILVTVLVTVTVTGRIDVAIQIGVAANVVKTGTYYCYERAWDRIEWGVVRQ